MSSVQSAKQICERALRAINAHQLGDTPDPAQLREAMIWLDMLLAENAGVTRLFSLVPGTVSFTLQNGVGHYDLLDALGADAPVDGIQFPIAAYLLTPSGTSVVGFSAAIPGAVAVGQIVSDLSAPGNVAPSTTITAINSGTKQITLSGPSTVQSADMLQFSTIIGTGQASAVGVTGQGLTTVTFENALPAGIAAGNIVADLANPAAVAPNVTITAINGLVITLSSVTQIAVNDELQFSSVIASATSTGTVNGPNQVAGCSLVRRHPIKIVKRDMFLARHEPNATGEPHMVYIDRLPDLQLYLHPFPSATDPIFRVLQLDVQTYAPNVAPAGVTGTQPQANVLTQFRQAWQRYLVFKLSADLGSGAILKLPQQSINNFNNEAQLAKDRLEAFENREHDDVPPICDPHDRQMTSGPNDRGSWSWGGDWPRYH